VRPPDVVVCDWDLGEELSDSFLHGLAATRPTIGRVLLSGSLGQPWQALVDAGVVHAALTKPFEPSDLVAAMRRAVASASSR
jgi:DNA-binding NarL/FixJ family response regulator